MAYTILIAGCGDLGSAVAERLDQEQFTIYGLRYSNKPLPDGLKLIQADITKASTLTALAALKPQILLYSIAASAQTDENYKAHYVDGLSNVLAAIDQSDLRHVFFVSSTRVYGQQTDELLDETSPAIPADFGGVRLLEAECLLKTLNCGTTVLRLSGIYGPGRTRMIRLAQDPQSWPQQNGWTNRIHRDDAAAFITFLIDHVVAQRVLENLYVVTDDLPVTQYEVLVWIAEELGADVSNVQIPATSSGKRLSNKRLRKSGYRLKYPDYRDGYTSLMAG